MVYQDNNLTFEELLRKDGSVTIHQRNKQKLATEMYKIIHDLSPSFMNSIFPFPDNPYNLRNHNDFKIKKKNIKTTYYGSETTYYGSETTYYGSETTHYGSETTYYGSETTYYGSETIAFQGPRIWRLVPENIKTSNNLNEFKTKIRNWQLEGCSCRICKVYLDAIGFLK